MPSRPVAYDSAFGRRREESVAQRFRSPRKLHIYVIKTVAFNGAGSGGSGLRYGLGRERGMRASGGRGGRTFNCARFTLRGRRGCEAYARRFASHADATGAAGAPGTDGRSGCRVGRPRLVRRVTARVTEDPRERAVGIDAIMGCGAPVFAWRGFASSTQGGRSCGSQECFRRCFEKGLPCCCSWLWFWRSACSRGLW